MLYLYRRCKLRTRERSRGPEALKTQQRPSDASPCGCQSASSYAMKQGSRRAREKQDKALLSTKQHASSMAGRRGYRPSAPNARPKGQLPSSLRELLCVFCNPRKQPVALLLYRLARNHGGERSHTTDTRAGPRHVPPTQTLLRTTKTTQSQPRVLHLAPARGRVTRAALTTRDCRLARSCCCVLICVQVLDAPTAPLRTRSDLSPSLSLPRSKGGGPRPRAG